MKQNKNNLGVLMLILILVIIGAGFYFIFFYSPSQVVWKTVEVATSTPVAYYSQLDGLVVSSTEAERPEVLGIMMDNYPGIEQYGLSAAKVVYEAPAEGGTTRYLAIFDKNQPVEKVGPVRSARPYYAELMGEYNGSAYLYCGGSPAALKILAATKAVIGINEFYNGRYFYRDNNLEAPHNLFTDSEHWQNIKTSGPTNWRGWKFTQNFSASASSTVQAVKIKYSPFYEVSWKYDSGANKWLRFKNDKAQYDANNNQQIMADDVVIQEVRIKVLDEIGRLEIDLVGQGSMRLLRRGAAQRALPGGELARGVWKKEENDNRTRFFDANDEEMELAPGQIWVEVIPRDMDVEVTR